MRKASQIPRIFAILRGWPRHLIADLNEEALTSTTGIYKSIGQTSRSIIKSDNVDELPREKDKTKVKYGIITKKLIKRRKESPKS